MPPSSLPRNTPSGARATAQLLTAAFGGWLVISAFVWPHSSAETVNTWVSGAVIVAAGLLSVAAPPVRYVNTVVALWVFLAAWALPFASAGTIWNNAFTAAAVLIASLVPAGPSDAPRGFLGPLIAARAPSNVPERGAADAPRHET
jgi:hypothetical protein